MVGLRRFYALPAVFKNFNFEKIERLHGNDRKNKECGNSDTILGMQLASAGNSVPCSEKISKGAVEQSVWIFQIAISPTECLDC